MNNYSINWYEYGQEYVATCSWFPCTTVGNKDPQKALTELMELVDLHIEDMKSNGEVLPQELHRSK